MAYSYSELVDQANDWGHQATEAGWLTVRQASRLQADKDQNPTSLFASQEHRPLVVAFFGGTGVGKSSLLNRLAGQSVAKTGVVRPTSREVSIYLHESIHIEQLPKDFPVERIRIARHQEHDKKEIMWVDMPDMDSTDQSNHAIVMGWMPHVDVLIYVVNPERYRDEKGWRLLLSRGHQHGWLFVMNQWDLGRPEQLGDFKKQIIQAGFSDPIILRTDCRPPDKRKTDDFKQLETMVMSLANTHTIRQLDVRGIRIRTESLQKTLQQCLQDLGPKAPLDSLLNQWDIIWQPATKALQEGLQWPIQQIAKTYVDKDNSLFSRRLKIDTEDKVNADSGSTREALWDDWVQARVDDALDQLLLEVDATGVPAKPFKATFDGVRSRARRTVLAQAEQSLRHALANPGNLFQRLFIKLVGFLSVVLPLAAIGWVSYEVFHGFYKGTVATQPFRGTDFAINSGIMIAVAWLLPWFMYRTLKPSTEKVARKGLRKGLENGLDKLKSIAAVALEDTLEQRNDYQQRGLKVSTLCHQPPALEQGLSHELLQRMLVESKLDSR